MRGWCAAGLRTRSSTPSKSHAEKKAKKTKKADGEKTTKSKTSKSADGEKKTRKRCVVLLSQREIARLRPASDLVSLHSGAAAGIRASARAMGAHHQHQVLPLQQPAPAVTCSSGERGSEDAQQPSTVCSPGHPRGRMRDTLQVRLRSQGLLDEGGV